MGTPTLYQWAGGSDALERLFEVFYRDHVPHDELLAPIFAGMSPEHPHHVALWLAEVFGGPDRYTQEHGTPGGGGCRLTTAGERSTACGRLARLS
ncbi:MAG: hypothetical protein ACR2ND_03610 [Solirubrobacteraceae bacterium]